MFLLVCSNKDGSIKVKSHEIEKIIAGKESGKPTIFDNGIVLNWNMYSGVVEDKPSKDEMIELRRIGKTFEEARKEVEGGVSPFAKLLAGKMKMLSDKSRTEV